MNLFYDHIILFLILETVIYNDSNTTRISARKIRKIGTNNHRRMSVVRLQTKQTKLSMRVPYFTIQSKFLVKWKMF